jgi:hypothetical protein
MLSGAMEVSMGRMMLLGVGGIVAVVAALKLFTLLFGTVLAIAAFLLFKVLPVVLIGWLVLKVWRHLMARPVD